MAGVTKNTKKKTDLGKIFPYLARFKWRIILSVLLLTASKMLAVADPYVLKTLIDELVEQGSDAQFQFLAGLVALFFILRWGTNALDGIKDYVFATVDANIRRLIALDVFQHLLGLSVDFHTNQATGNVARKITRGSTALEYLLFFLTSNIFPTLIEIVLVTGVFIFLFPISFTFVLLAFVAVYVAFTIIVTEYRQKLLLEKNKQDDEAGGRSVDALMNYETVKYFTNEGYEYGRYDSTLGKWVRMSIRSTKLGANLNMGQGFIITAGLTALLALAIQEYLRGNATIGDFVLVTTYMNRIAIPLTFLGFIYRRVKEGLANVDEMFKLLDVKNTVQDKPGAGDLTGVLGRVEFQNVSFSYRQDRQVLENISIDIPAQKSVALVGYSGSGKSTISKLLLRFYDPDSGRILIDGKDIHDVTQHSLRQHIGVVAQDTPLFNDTIFHNIAYGKPGATQEEIEAVAKVANIHDFIVQKLPEGYETRVGERGVKLSGGEKQRVAIARMLLKNPPILVFDEATASLDSESEKTIQNAIQHLSHEGRTTIVIAHRLSTIVDFDKIVVMENGKVVEEGNHETLLRTSGLYRRLWDIQHKKKDLIEPEAV